MSEKAMVDDGFEPCFDRKYHFDKDLAASLHFFSKSDLIFHCFIGEVSHSCHKE